MRKILFVLLYTNTMCYESPYVAITDIVRTVLSHIFSLDNINAVLQDNLNFDITLILT